MALYTFFIEYYIIFMFLFESTWELSLYRNLNKSWNIFWTWFLINKLFLLDIVSIGLKGLTPHGVLLFLLLIFTNYKSCVLHLWWWEWFLINRPLASHTITCQLRKEVEMVVSVICVDMHIFLISCVYTSFLYILQTAFFLSFWSAAIHIHLYS